MKKQPTPSTASLAFGLHQPKPKKAPAKTASAEQPPRRARVLMVDDDEDMLRLLGIRLTDAGYEVKPATGVAAALDACPQFQPDLIITDLCMSPVDGLGLLEEVQKRWPSLCVIIQSGHGSISAAVRATQNGAFGFLVKPVDKQELLEQVARALKVSSFGDIPRDWRAAIVSRSHLMEERIAQANLAAKSDEPVLLTGEVGTGKELFARAIHEAGARREEPFHVVSCSALGARLHASTPQADDFDFAGGGSLLLEDVDELPTPLQLKLFAALAAAGRSAPHSGARRGSARLICTTARDLEQLVEDGRFHADLYERISGIAIEVPPLGRRREDIPLLIGHFLTQAMDEDGKEKHYAPKAIELLTARNWPGNVDQLRSVVKKSIALSPTKLMTVEFVRQCLDEESTKSLPSFDEAREEFSRNYLVQNLRITEGNVSQAARLAKRNRTDFYKLMSRHNVDPEAFKKPGSK
jgi:two-component system response regulator GlrR